MQNNEELSGRLIVKFKKVVTLKAVLKSRDDSRDSFLYRDITHFSLYKCRTEPGQDQGHVLNRSRLVDQNQEYAGTSPVLLSLVDKRDVVSN